MVQSLEPNVATSATSEAPGSPPSPALRHSAKQSFADNDCVEIGEEWKAVHSPYSAGPVAVVDYSAEQIKKAHLRSSELDQATFAQRNELWHLRRLQRWG